MMALPLLLIAVLLAQFSCPLLLKEMRLSATNARSTQSLGETEETAKNPECWTAKLNMKRADFVVCAKDSARVDGEGFRRCICDKYLCNKNMQHAEDNITKASSLWRPSRVILTAVTSNLLLLY